VTDEVTQWVIPEKFVDELGAVLADAPPLPGEEAARATMPLIWCCSGDSCF
jgi:hypothetical protein